MNKLCRGGNANHRLSLRTAQAAGRWFGTAQIYAIFIEYAKNCFGFYTVNVNAAGVRRVAGFYLFSAISRQAKTSKPVSLLGTQGYAGEGTKKHSPPRTCAARGGLSVEKGGKKQGVRTTGHLRAAVSALCRQILTYARIGSSPKIPNRFIHCCKDAGGWHKARK